MKKQHYITSDGVAAQCSYFTIPSNLLPGGSSAVVFIQLEKHPRIEDDIERIVSAILREDLAGTNPGTLRFFQYLPKNTNRDTEWQEVIFSQSSGLFFKADLLTVTIRSWFKSPPNYWLVEGPCWAPVHETLAHDLVQCHEAACSGFYASI
jgi:hypothetical protein